MNAPDLVKLYYDTLRSKRYKPMECWGRDGQWAKKFLATGRTAEDFVKLLNKALVGPKKFQMAVCKGLHIFMTVLPEIELLDEAPWEPSLQERAANVKFIEAATKQLLETTQERRPKEWIRDTTGKWVRSPGAR